MKPDTHLGENARQIEVSDDQTMNRPWFRRHLQAS